MGFWTTIKYKPQPSDDIFIAARGAFFTGYFDGEHYRMSTGSIIRSPTHWAYIPPV